LPRFSDCNYVCHRTDKPTVGGGTAILVRRGIFHHSVPVPGVIQLEATAIQVTLSGKPVIILAAYLSTFRPLIGHHRLFRLGITSLDIWRPQRQIRGLELAVEHDTGKIPT